MNKIIFKRLCVFRKALRTFEFNVVACHKLPGQDIERLGFRAQRPQNLGITRGHPSGCGHKHRDRK